MLEKVWGSLSLDTRRHLGQTCAYFRTRYWHAPHETAAPLSTRAMWYGVQSGMLTQHRGSVFVGRQTLAEPVGPDGRTGQVGVITVRLSLTDARLQFLAALDPSKVDERHVLGSCGLGFQRGILALVASVAEVPDRAYLRLEVWHNSPRELQGRQVDALELLFLNNRAEQLCTASRLSPCWVEPWWWLVNRGAGDNQYKEMFWQTRFARPPGSLVTDCFSSETDVGWSAQAVSQV